MQRLLVNTAINQKNNQHTHLKTPNGTFMLGTHTTCFCWKVLLKKHRKPRQHQTMRWRGQQGAVFAAPVPPVCEAPSHLSRLIFANKLARAKSHTANYRSRTHRWRLNREREAPATNTTTAQEAARSQSARTNRGGRGRQTFHFFMCDPNVSCGLIM